MFMVFVNIFVARGAWLLRGVGGMNWGRGGRLVWCLWGVARLHSKWMSPLKSREGMRYLFGKGGVELLEKKNGSGGINTIEGKMP